jgi:hypothetical protein
MNLEAEQDKMRQRQLAAMSELVLRRERNPRRHGVRYWTYLIQGEKTGLVKIGRSHNIVKRFRALSSSSPDRLTLVGAISGDYEKSLHRSLAKERYHGEWFNPTVIPLIRERLEVIEGDFFFPK